MAKAGDVRVDFTARDRTATAFRSLERNLDRTTRSFAGLSNTLGSLAAGAGLTLFIRNGINAAANLNVLSRRLNTTVENLSSLDFAAASSGVSTEQLTLTIQRLNRRVSEAEQGIGGDALTRAFKNLGISTSELIKLDPADQFRELARAVREGRGDIASLARIVDSEGVPGVRNLAAELENLEDKARNTGAVMSTQTAKGAEDLTTSMEQLGRAVQNVLINALVKVPQAIGRALAGAAGAILISTVEEADAAIAKLRTSIERNVVLVEALSSQPIIDRQQQRQIDEATNALKQQSEQYQDLIALRQTLASLAPAPSPVSAISAEQQAAAAAAAERLRIEAEAQAKLTALRLTNAEKTFRQLETLTLNEQDKLIRSFEDSIAQAEQAFIAAGGKISVGQLNALTDALSEKLRQDLESVADQGTETAQQLTVDFRGFFVSVEDGISSLREQFARFLLDLANRAINTQLGSLFGGLFASNSFFKGLGSLFGFAQGGSFTVPPGGPLSGPDSQVVAFRAKPGERVDVTPTGRGGGGGVVLSTNIDARGASLELAARLPEILERNNRQLILEVERRRLVGVRS